MTTQVSNRSMPKRAFGGPLREETKSRTTLCIPSGMLTAAHEAMKQSKFSLKRRSQWIEEAVELFLTLPDFEDMVLEEFIEPGGNTTIPVTIRSRLAEKIDNAIQLLHQQGELNVERSGVLRTAISQAILRQRGLRHAR